MATHSCGFLWLCSLLIIPLHCKFVNTDVPIHEICAIENYNYLNITAVIWALSLEPDQCLPVSTQDDYSDTNLLSASCELILGFCQKVPLPDPCKSSSVCQKSPQGLLSLGAYVDNPFSSQEPLPGGVDGFHTYFYNGSAYNTTTKTHCLLQTAITLQCNHSAPWDVSGAQSNRVVSAPTPRALHYDATNCQMKITFDYAGACEIEHVEDSYLSVGTVLIIIFFITVFLYLTLGAMHNAIRGHTGMQLVPHVQFWASLPGYIKAGCVFTCCCQCRSESDSYAQI